MHWLFPDRLYFLLLLPVLAGWLFLGFRLRKRSLEKLGEARLLGPLVAAPPPWMGFCKGLCLLIAVGLAMLAWARPQWGMEQEEVTAAGVDIVLAVDTSLSMLANDIQPSRLVRAKLELSALVKALEGNRTGVVAFSGAAAAVSPLTLDTGAVSMFLDSLEPGMVQPQGTRLGDALRESMKLLGERPDTSKIIILVTDGEDHGSRPLMAAREAAEMGVVIHTVGLGSVEGTPIPIRNARGNVTEYKKDEDGEIVLSKLDEGLLREIASVTGGLYLPARMGINIDALLEAVASMEQSEFESKLGRRYKERFMWPLAAALVFLSLEFLIPGRRKKDTPSMPAKV